MSLGIDLTNNRLRILEAEKEASRLLRAARGVVPPVVYGDLQVQLCIIASELEKLKVNLGTLRMIGELEKMPPTVTAERLELAQCVPMVPAHVIRNERAAFALELQRIGDDTLISEEGVEV